MSASSSYMQAAERKIRREQKLVHLQGVGDMPGTPAGELETGDRLMWNYGSVYEVTSVRQASPQFVAITERGSDGREWSRRLRKDRLVVRTRPGERFARATR